MIHDLVCGHWTKGPFLGTNLIGAYKECYDSQISQKNRKKIKHVNPPRSSLNGPHKPHANH